MRHPRYVRTAFAAVLLMAAAFLVAPTTAATAAGEARLSLFKRIENLATGSSIGDRSLWDVQAVNVATGETFRGQGLNGIQSMMVPPGTYEISEIVRADTPGGYRFVEWECGGSITNEPVRTITVSADEQLTCTVENEAISPTITLIKEVEGGTADPSLWTLQAQGPTNIQGPGNSDAVTAQPARIGRYQLSESGGPAGYTASPWSCTATTLAGQSSPLPVDASGGIDVDLDQSVVCSIRNTGSLPRLTLAKQVDGPAGQPLDDATEWTLSAAGPTPVSGATGSAAASHVPISPGTYALSESGPGGYTAGEWACVDQVTSQPITVTDGSVSIDGDEDVRCAIVNSFAGGWLTLVKTVDGTQPAQAWTLAADGAGEQIEGRVGDPSITREAVPVGTYDLSEAGPTEGYTTAGWQCTNSTGFVDAVVVAAGDDVTCTIENVSQTSHLTLVKQVVNTGGGTLTAEDWTLSATGPVDAFSGVSGTPEVSYAPIVAGTYELGETSAAADAGLYAASDWACVDDETGDAAPMPNGSSVEIDGTEDSVTCTITNSWTRSTLTLQKRVIAQFGSAPPLSSWVLQAESEGSTLSGASGSPEVTRVSIPADQTWTLSEISGPDGFEPLGWSCLGVSSGPSGAVTIPGGRDIVCEALNNGVTPQITLVKEIDDDAGGSASIMDFVLKTRGPGNAAFAGASGTDAVTGLQTPPGEYVFSEDGPAGYDVSWSCAGAEFDETREVATLAYGDRAVCTALNVAIAPTLSLVKQVVGGDADPELWTLSAVGPTTLSGDGEVEPTEAVGGVYALSESSDSDSAADYAPGEWTCAGDGYPGSGGLRQTGAGTAELTLPLDADVTCTIVNTFGDPGQPTTPPDPGDPDPGGPGGGAGGDPGGALPGTGGDGTLALVLAAAALAVIAGGAGLLVAGRRRARR